MRLQYHTRNIQRIEGGLRQPGVLLALRMASVVDAAPGEFIEALFEEAASAVRDGASWAEKRNIAMRHIQPEKPQQNAYIERCNRTVRYDWLNQYLFESLVEIQEFATAWLWTYNNERPNRGIGGITTATAWLTLSVKQSNGITFSVDWSDAGALMRCSRAGYPYKTLWMLSPREFTVHCRTWSAQNLECPVSHGNSSLGNG